jgi:nucleoside-diphosphate-sugar epimerase
MMKVLGAAATRFIGARAALWLRVRSDRVTGVDILNDYCGPALKVVRAPVAPTAMIEIREQALGRLAGKIMCPIQMGDVTKTFADLRKLNSVRGYRAILLPVGGIPRFVQ